MNSLSIDLLEDLIERTQENIKKVEQLQLLPEESLNKRNSQNSWSILECIEHLNRYSDFYLPEIETRISSSLYQASENFRSGLLGNYFALSMLPKEKLNSMCLKI